MSEKIYTIPVNEAFDGSFNDKEKGDCGCPFCRLYRKLQNDEIGIILGAAMMNPETRLQTNEKGFCRDHYDLMIKKQSRLSLGLMLESHLDSVREEMKSGGSLISRLKKPGSGGVSEKLKKLETSCYICDRISYSFERMLVNAALLWDEDDGFKIKTEKQPYFCLPHFRMWIDAAKNSLDKKVYSDFYKAVSEVTGAYFDELRHDTSWFCKKFDYRYENESWGNSKDAIERAEKFLCGDVVD